MAFFATCDKTAPKTVRAFINNDGVTPLPNTTLNIPVVEADILSGAVQIGMFWDGSVLRFSTQAEIDTAANAAKDIKLDAIDVLQLAISFDMENRVRVLEAKPTITAAQYRAALKARL